MGFMSEIERVKLILEKVKITQIELAKKIGVSTKTLRSWLTGKSEPRGRNAENIRRVYNELFGKGKNLKKKSKEDTVFTKKRLDEILLGTKAAIVEPDDRREEKEARKKYYDAKLIALTLEKQNRGRLILFPSVSKVEGEWYKMGGNSALFYLYYVAPRLKKKPKLRQDTDIKYRFKDGIIMVHWGDDFIKRMEKIGFLAKKIDYGLVDVDLKTEFTVAEIKEMRGRAEEDEKRFREMVMPKENFPDVYGLIRKLAQVMLPKVKHLDINYRRVFGDYLVMKIMRLYEDYFRVANGVIKKEEGYRLLLGEAEDLCGLVLLSDEVEWFDITTRTRFGETLADLKVALERRFCEKSKN